MVSTLTSLVRSNRNNWYQNKKAPVDRLFLRYLAHFTYKVDITVFHKIRYNRIITPTLLCISILFLLVMKYIHHAKMSMPLYVKTLEIPFREP